MEVPSPGRKEPREGRSHDEDCAIGECVRKKRRAPGRSVVAHAGDDLEVVVAPWVVELWPMGVELGDEPRDEVLVWRARSAHRAGGGRERGALYAAADWPFPFASGFAACACSATSSAIQDEAIAAAAERFDASRWLKVFVLRQPSVAL